jgi:adenylate cyclase class 2
MHTETEVKLAVESFDGVRGQLVAGDAVRIGCVIETNWFFDRPDRSLAAGDQGLRIRAVDPVDGSSAPAVLTYKGPANAGPIKSRPELELTIAEPDAARELLLAIGFVEILVYQKRRESWQFWSCRVELDELPHLDRFVEIEGPDQQTIVEARRRLGLAEAAVADQSYLAMLLRYVERQGLASPRVMLDE